MCKAPGVQRDIAHADHADFVVASQTESSLKGKFVLQCNNINSTSSHNSNNIIPVIIVITTVIIMAIIIVRIIAPDYKAPVVGTIVVSN